VLLTGEERKALVDVAIDLFEDVRRIALAE
jgi:hypothetical protein